MYRPISVLNVSCPHAVAHPYLAVVMLTIYLYLRSPSVSILQASPCVCLLHGLLGWPVSDVCLCSRTLSTSRHHLSCLIAMTTNTMEVNGNCNVVSLSCFTGQRNWSFCELRVVDNVRRIKAIRWLILLPHTGTLDPLMTNYMQPRSLMQPQSIKFCKTSMSFPNRALVSFF